MSGDRADDSEDLPTPPPITWDEWLAANVSSPPARPDDTVVISGGRRATQAEVRAYVAAWEAHVAKGTAAVFDG